MLRPFDLLPDHMLDPPPEEPEEDPEEAWLRQGDEAFDELDFEEYEERYGNL
jgi:hypothetical protein